ncbi:ABC transporter substrate-binding protein [Arthrobacter sp. ISL-30]|uniref:ABC transporter substrate-binding protein n=1 Tax=Arthrobacter sp. ISL-30 TaxID=2819109 RepID=UPI002034EAAD|nr:ABC transporter substrate-binding protein [Arthrobacter sp. ISL-30]
MRFTKAGLAAALAAGLALTGCASAGSDTQGQTSKSLTLGNVLAPATFEARNLNWGNQSIYFQAVYDSLLKPSPNGKDVEPHLATKWDYNADKTVLTVKLRDDVTFTDGTPFTAEVAAQNLLRFRDGTSPQRSKILDLADATAKDKTTLEIKLKQANPAFLIYLAQAAGMQESPAAFDKPDVKTNPVGSGPYVLKTSDTVVGTSYKFEKNPKYWDAGSVKYDRLTINVYNDATSLLNALRGKQLDAAAVGDNSILPQVEGAGFKLNGQNLNFAGLLLFDRAGKTNPALGNIKVRQAINYAVDTDAMMKVVALGRAESTRQVFREESHAYDEKLNDRYNYDPAKARELVKEAGYPNGVELTVPTSSAFPKQLWPLLQQQLGDVGIKVNLVDVGQNLIADLQGQKFGLSYFTLQRDANEWQLISNMLSPTATWNTFKYQDPKVDELIETIRTAEGDARDKALKELNTYIVDQAWFAPWYSQTLYFVTNAGTNVELNAGNAWPNLWNITPKA